ncbi:hypothetical protein A3K74_02155 [Candidatus Pacearchaeota archaeon RBG_13_33_26]|nr:MAG: hypothetical protein A3K74_02155 [Candidatus Pacearchaeota archaeon RBG_13_33_26]
MKSDELMLKVRQEYYLLSLMSSDNELLKYYVLKRFRGRLAFWPRQDDAIQAEFFRKFGRGLPELISDLESRDIKLSGLEYSELINSFILQSYYDALKREVAPPEMRN